MSLKTFIAGQFKKPTGFWGKLAVRMMMKGNVGAIKFTIESVDIKPNDVLLEIGFGHGVSFKMIAEKTNEKIYGLDFSEDMVKLASENNRDLIHNNRLELKYGPVHPAPFQNNFFDKVIAVNVIYFWDEPHKELSEIKRILKPGGKVALYLTDKKSMENISFAKTHVFNRYTADEFAEIVNQAGFVNVKYDSKVMNKGIEYLCHCLVAEKEN